MIWLRKKKNNEEERVKVIVGKYTLSQSTPSTDGYFETDTVGPHTTYQWVRNPLRTDKDRKLRVVDYGYFVEFPGTSKCPHEMSGKHYHETKTPDESFEDLMRYLRQTGSIQTIELYDRETQVMERHGCGSSLVVDVLEKRPLSLEERTELMQLYLS